MRGGRTLQFLQPVHLMYASMLIGRKLGHSQKPDPLHKERGERFVCVAMRQRILGSHTPPCHRRMVITTQFNVLPCCIAAQTSSVPHQVV